MGSTLFSLVVFLSFLSLQSSSLLELVALRGVAPDFNIHAIRGEGGREWGKCTSDSWVIAYEGEAASAGQPPPCHGSTTLSNFTEAAATMELDVVAAVNTVFRRVHVFPASYYAAPRAVCVDGSGSLLLGNMAEMIADGPRSGLQCRDMVQLYAPMTLDLALLEDLVAPSAASDLLPHDWAAVCAGLHRGLLEGARRFTVTHAHLSNGPDTMQYWLSLCGLDRQVLEVQLRTHPTLLGGRYAGQRAANMSAADHNLCLVERVIDPAGQLLLSPNSAPDVLGTLLCLEDVIGGLLVEEASVVFLSALGLPIHASSGIRERSHRAIPEDSRAARLDLLGAISAFQTVVRETRMSPQTKQTYPVLRVMSARGAMNPVKSTDVGMPAVFTPAIKAATPEEWEEALMELVDSLPLLLGGGDSCLSSSEMLCQHAIVSNWYQLSSSLLALSKGLDNLSCTESFLCTHSYAQVQLGLLVVNVLDPFLGRGPGTLDGPAGGLLPQRALSLASELCATSRVGHYDEAVIGADHGSIMTERFPYSEGAFQVHVQELSVGVLIFVASSWERAQAEELLASWNERCPLCNLCVSYMILLQSQGFNFRSQLLSVSEWIEAKSVNIDVVLVLSGIEAMAAFRPPGSAGALIPVISLDHASFFQLPYDVVFAHNTKNSAGSGTRTHPASCEESVDIRAFAGLAYQIRYFVQSALQDPAGVFSDARLRDAFLKHVCSSELLASSAAIDTTHRVFDFRVTPKPGSQLDKSNSGVEDSMYSGYLDRMSLISGRALTTFPSQDEQFRVPAKMLKEIRSFSLEKTVSYIEKDMTARRFIAGFQKLLAFYLSNPRADVAEEVAIFMYRYARQMKYYALPVEQQAGSVRLLENFLAHSAEDTDAECRRDEDNMTLLSRIADVTQSVYTMLSALLTELGSAREAIDLFALQIPPVTFAAVQIARRQWGEQRKLYSTKMCASGPCYQTHLYTVASHNKTELQNLEFTARMAGMQLHVLGIGQEYKSWLQKLEWYVEALLTDANNDVADDDILVMMDAYDVLLTPMIRQLGKFIGRSSTPLLACSENGQYPEPEAPWLYPRGSYSAFSPPREILPSHNIRVAKDKKGIRRVGGTTRFLNSGCVAGRARDVKDFLRDIFHEMNLVRDDQQVYVRHFLRHPHLISVDAEQHNEHLQQSSVFQCGWRVPMEAFTELAHTGVARFYGDYLPVGLYHMNNRQSEPLYQALVGMFRQLHEVCFEGMFGPRLLAALHLIVDGEGERARRVLDELMREAKEAGFGPTSAVIVCGKNIASGLGLPV
mmetsp:Transcript_9040/g.16962  ORF Transcript_9040/g.16962 Transcript_9040/m.16962 type:complete len:1292 (-) Transcript_9040:256-4131(-)